MFSELFKIRLVLISFLLILLFTLNGVSIAQDISGCLTCHKYPGLLRRDDSGHLIILHIDEKRWADTPHAELGCKECHDQITKVPHTGILDVSCSTDCHEDGKEGWVEKEKLDLSIFHAKEQSYLSSIKDDLSCMICHPMYPHHENTMVRSFLNLHTAFVECTACHVNRDSLKTQLSYAWNNTENAEYRGNSFGTFLNPTVAKGKKKDTLVRIAAMTKVDGALKPFHESQDISRAKLYVVKEKSMGEEEKKKELEFFHRHTAKKESSVACNECHSEQTVLPLKELGYDEKKIKDNKFLNIKRLVTKYKVFYLPNFLAR